MPAILELVVFWLALFGFLAVVVRYSHIAPVRLLFTWHGPEPEVGETLSRYYFRRCLWVAVVLLQSVALLSLTVLAVRHWPALAGGPVEFFGMLLPLFAFLLLIAAIRYAFLAIKAKVFGPNPVIQAPDPAVEA